jgi:hypothetical protein
MSVAKGALFAEPFVVPLAPLTNAALANATLTFWLSRTSGPLNTPAAIYRTANLASPFASNVVTATSIGQFTAIYLPPNIPVRYQLIDQYGRTLADVDPYIPNGRFLQTAIVQPGDQQNNTTTLSIDPYLQIALPSAGTYRYEIHASFLLGDTNHNPELNFDMAVEGGGSTTNLYNVIGYAGGLLQNAPSVGTPPPSLLLQDWDADFFVDPQVAVATAAYGDTGVVGYSTTLSTTAQTALHVIGVISVQAPCTLAFAWSPNTSVSTELILMPGSYMKAELVSQTNAVLASQTGASLNATASPTSLSAEVFTATGTPSTSVSALPSGGSGGYTYSWAMVSGGTNIGINSPSSQSTTFSLQGTVSQGTTYTGTAQCTVQDSSGHTATVNVSINIKYAVALSATASPTSLSSSGSGTSQTTASTTVTPSGGTSGYTYAWAFTAGGTNLTINSPTAATTTITGSGMTPGYSYSGTLQCTVTDAFGYTTTLTTAVSISVACQDINTNITIGSAQHTTGFLSAAINGGTAVGSIGTANDTNGNPIGACYLFAFGVNVSFNIAIQGTLAQNYVASFTVNGVTLSTSAAGVQFATGQGSGSNFTEWTFPSSAGFTMPYNTSQSGSVAFTSP